MALVKVKDDHWIQTDLVLEVVKNTTTGSIEVFYFGSGGKHKSTPIAGMTTDAVAEKIQPPVATQ